jgi:gliding motility-associated-like protein
MNRLLLITILLLFPFSVLIAQSESNNWYFGKKAGLNFSGPNATALLGGQVNAHGGSASISDSNGNLLFYTNGMTVWNKNHVQMPNGWGLLGHASATQNSIIIPKPGSNTIYYVFTNDKSDGTEGLRYSEVDITLAGGMGDVTANKNIAVVDSTAEKLTATLHANETDFWVITHGRNDNSFSAIPVTASGVGTPVVSNSGTIHSGINAGVSALEGQMKVSPDGTKIALATSANGHTFEIFDFNNTTGQVSNPITISGSTYDTPYGVEFSPDGTKLYCSLSNNQNKVYQFNMQAGSPGAIISSGTLVITSSSPTIGGMQLGPDSKIYLARYLNEYMGVINFPNSPGTTCNYVDDGVYLDGEKSRRGTPNFIQSYFNNPRFSYLNLCFGDSTQFFISDINGVNSVLWNFGDPASGAANTSTDFSPYHIFSAPGSFDVTLIRNLSAYSDTVTQQITIHSLPNVNLGGQLLSICEGTDTVLFAGYGFASYLWQNGSVTNSITASDVGIYSVTVTDDFGCKNSDEITIEHLPPPAIDLGSDKAICEESPITLDASFEEGEYLWSTGETVASITVNIAGQYFVTVTNRCGETTDSIDISVYPTIEFELGNDHEICPGDTVLLDPSDLGSSYQWSTGSTDQAIIVTTTGTYSLVAFYPNTNCVAPTDSVTVTVLETPTVSTSPDTVICEGDVVFIEAFGDFITDYMWSNGSQSNGFSIGVEGLYYVTVSNVCASDSDSVYVAVNPIPSIFIGNDTAIYDDETIQLAVDYNSNWLYSWTPAYGLSDTTIFNPVASPQTTTTYQVEVTDTLGCRDVATITIEVSERPLPELEFYNTFTPNGDGTNDFWVIDNAEDYENSVLEIYNRNGHKIYSAKNYQNDWDGTRNGKDVPAHTYFYLFYPGEGETEVYKGSITIIR